MLLSNGYGQYIYLKKRTCSYVSARYWKSENVPGASVQLKAFYFHKDAVFIIILETKAICLAYIYIFLKGTFTKYIFITRPFTSGSRKRCLDFMSCHIFFFWHSFGPFIEYLLRTLRNIQCALVIAFCWTQYFYLRYTRLA